MSLKYLQSVYIFKCPLLNLKCLQSVYIFKCPLLNLKCLQSVYIFKCPLLNVSLSSLDHSHLCQLCFGDLNLQIQVTLYTVAI